MGFVANVGNRTSIFGKNNVGQTAREEVCEVVNSFRHWTLWISQNLLTSIPTNYDGDLGPNLAIKTALAGHSFVRSSGYDCGFQNGGVV
jgi:hypothetical protein